jgi:peptide deformylase
MGKRFFLKLVVVVFISLSAFLSCTIDGFTKKEIGRILSASPGSTIPLLTINNKSDSLLLRQKARPISKIDIGSSSMEKLKSQMLQIVTDSLNHGVGIAAPQVGVGVQMIYIQRFDKEGEPFEVYFNPKIVMYGDSINSGTEGCLSVPGYRGKVDRSHNIKISYLDSMGKKQKETVNGFTAVIFQHEVDHLNGTIYFDKVYGGFSSLIPVEGK